VGRKQAVLAMQNPPNSKWDIQIEAVPVAIRSVPNGTGKAPTEYVEKLLLDNDKGVRSMRPVTDEDAKTRIAIHVKGTYKGGQKESGNAGVNDRPYLAFLDINANGQVAKAWPRGTSDSPARRRLPLDGEWHYLGTENDLVGKDDINKMMSWFFDPKND